MLSQYEFGATPRESHFLNFVFTSCDASITLINSFGLQVRR